MPEKLIKHDIKIGDMDNNCYILNIDGRDDCVIIDCSGNGKKIMAKLDELGLNPQVILLTHGHFDHMSGVNNLKKAYPELKVAIGKDDAEMLTSSEKNLSLLANSQAILVPEADILISDGDRLNYADIEINCVHAPGHTKGGVCYLVENYMFSGDVLFKNSIGRTDLPGGSVLAIKKTLSELFDFDKNYEVFPGHDGFTTLEYESKNNEYLLANAPEILKN